MWPEAGDGSPCVTNLNSHDVAQLSYKYGPRPVAAAVDRCAVCYVDTSFCISDISITVILCESLYGKYWVRNKRYAGDLRL